MLARTLSFLDGEYLLRWSKRHYGGLPSAALIFTSEAIARRALENLGGGTRGLFRVTQPAWAARGVVRARDLRPARAARMWYALGDAHGVVGPVERQRGDDDAGAGSAAEDVQTRGEVSRCVRAILGGGVGTRL